MSLRRGHLLLEAMIASAVLLMTIAGVATAVRSAANEVSLAADEQQAMAIVEAEAEKLRLQPLRAWDAGVREPVTVAGRPGWIVTVEIRDLTDTASPGASFKRAEVRLDYRGRRAVMEAYKW